MATVNRFSVWLGVVGALASVVVVAAGWSPLSSSVAPREDTEGKALSGQVEPEIAGRERAPSPVGNLAAGPWTPGVEQRYSTDFGTTLQTDEDSPDGSITVMGTASLSLVATKVSAEGVLVRGQIDNVSLVVGSEEADGKHIEESVKGSIERPFALAIGPSGQFESISLDPIVQGFARNILRIVVGALQFVTPSGGGSDKDHWFTEEVDHNGRYRAHYERLGEAEFKKTKVAYTYLDVAAKLQLKEGGAAAKVESETRFHKDGHGRSSKVSAVESLLLPMGDKQFTAQTHATLELQGIRRMDVSGLEMSGLVTTDLLTLGPSERSRAGELERKRALVNGAALEDFLTELEGIGATNENFDARYDVVERMAALFDLQPEAVRAAEFKLRRNISSEDGGLVLAALSDAMTTEAHDALARVAEDPAVPAGLRNSALSHLGLLDEPTDQTLSTLERLATDPSDPTRQAEATLALGSAARHGAAEEATSSTSERASKGLAERLASAKSSEELRLYLEAIGNAGSADALESIKRHLKSEDPSLRASAVRALRFIDSPEVDPLIASALTGDPDLMVRSGAISAARQRPLSPVLASAAASALQKETDESTRLGIVDWLGTQRDRLLLVRPILEAVVQQDASDKVKSAAATALDNLTFYG